mgnify:CR=1 FL=1
MNVGVLDDYQNVAAQCADWSRLGPDARVRFFSTHVDDSDELVAMLQPFEVLVAMRERTPFPAAVLARLPRLHLLVTTGMRNASIDLAACERHGVTVCGTGSNPLLAAEQAWAMVMALHKQIVANDHAVRRGAWQTGLGQTLSGLTLGVLGLGRLGAEMARLGKAFGMDVIAWSPNLTPERCAPHGVQYVSKAGLFAQADVISIHMVLTEQTHQLVGAAELAAMKPSAYLVNTSRGGLVDEAALCRALADGLIAGAALDVFEREPLPADAPILQAPNTVLSPHVGYASWQNYRTYYGDAIEDILAWQAGAPVRVLEPAQRP